MRKPTAKKLLLLPLIPAFALGMIEIATSIVVPNAVSMDRDAGWEPVTDRCIDCAMPA